MRENPKIKKGKYDQIIQDILRESSRSTRELRKLCLERGIPPSTYSRRIKQLKKYGIIEQIDIIRISERIEEADPEEVRECIRVIKKEENENVLRARNNQLRQLAAGKRVAHLPGVISCLVTLLEKPVVVHNSEVFEEILLTLEQIVNFEQQNRSPDSEKLVKDIVNRTLNRIVSAIDETPEFPGNAAIRYLGKTGRKEAVYILFKKMKSDPLQAKKSISDLTYALGKRNLYNKHKKLINDRLDEFLRSDDEPLLNLAKELNYQIRWVS